ncbi:MAG: response regulator [Anaerolineaceae bacterium]|nr:response regulator [Anaerolineaceae bacterium]
MPAQDKFSVLIVDDIPETQENIRRLLQFDNQIEVAGAARSGKEAIELSAEIKPDVVIMDINMPDMDGIQATELIRRKIPYIQVVILSVQSDQSYMRRAMLAGARDFLTKPPSIDELTAAIHRAGAMAQEERAKAAQAGVAGGAARNQPAAASLQISGKIIAVYSPKGGSGATTIATNLALALKKEEASVVLVDGNMQYGDVAVFLNEQVKNSVLDLAPRVDDLDPDIVKDVAITHAASGLAIIAAPPRLEMADRVVGEQFGKMLQYLRSVYNFIIVDLPSYLTETTQTAVDGCDLIVLITTQDIPAIKNIQTFLTLMDASEIKRDHILFILNRYDKRLKITPELISTNLRQPVSLVIPYDEDRAIVNSINRGVPLYLERKDHPISKNFTLLASKVQEQLSKIETETQPGMI